MELDPYFHDSNLKHDILIESNSNNWHDFNFGMTCFLPSVSCIRCSSLNYRGAGMFIGVDLVKDRKTKEPATAEAQYVSSR